MLIPKFDCKAYDAPPPRSTKFRKLPGWTYVGPVVDWEQSRGFASIKVHDWGWIPVWCATHGANYAFRVPDEIVEEWHQQGWRDFW